jgi:transcriptional regulator with XRE-family HTH domain
MIRNLSKRGRPKGRSKDQRSFGPLGDLIRKYRIEKSLGLLDVAKACKCSVQFISNIEHGRAPLPWEKAQSLAKYLEIPMEELQAANLAMRSDFQNFLGTPLRKKTKKIAASSLVGAKDSAILLAFASQIASAEDEPLRDILLHYQHASLEVKKQFCLTAKRALGLN